MGIRYGVFGSIGAVASDVSSLIVPMKSSIIWGARSRRPNPTMIAIAAPSPIPRPQASGVMRT